jgi:ADP-ribose pyrophosphatase YjhB (NUDIX family)
MTDKPKPLLPAEQIAFWADRLRDIAAAGLEYANNVYDQKRYALMREMALEMLAYATAQPAETFTPLRTTIFSRMSPVVAGAAAVIDQEGKVLLMRRADNHLWAMPAGQMEVGETPAEAVVRETFEETGVRCTPVALVGVYDSRRWERGALQHVYKFTFLCAPQDAQEHTPFEPHETLEIGWFAENDLPADLQPGHDKRISDAYAMRRGNNRAYFDEDTGQPGNY